MLQYGDWGMANAGLRCTNHGGGQSKVKCVGLRKERTWRCLCYC